MDDLVTIIDNMSDIAPADSPTLLIDPVCEVRTRLADYCAADWESLDPHARAAWSQLIHHIHSYRCSIYYPWELRYLLEARITQILATPINPFLMPKLLRKAFDLAWMEMQAIYQTEWEQRSPIPKFETSMPVDKDMEDMERRDGFNPGRVYRTSLGDYCPVAWEDMNLDAQKAWRHMLERIHAVNCRIESAPISARRRVRAWVDSKCLNGIDPLFLPELMEQAMRETFISIDELTADELTAERTRAAD